MPERPDQISQISQAAIIEALRHQGYEIHAPNPNPGIIPTAESTSAVQRPPETVVGQPVGRESSEAHAESPGSGPDSPESGPKDAELGTDRIGTYDPLAAAQEDHEVIVGLLTSITEALQGLREQIALQSTLQEQQLIAIERLLEAIQQLRLLIDELIKDGANQGPSLGYAASMQATVIETEIPDAAEQQPDSAWEKIKEQFKRVLARLWGMISKLLTVKEWALSGKVRAPGPLLGLAEASVTVTFGR